MFFELLVTGPMSAAGTEVDGLQAARWGGHRPGAACRVLNVRQGKLGGAHFQQSSQNVRSVWGGKKVAGVGQETPGVGGARLRLCPVEAVAGRGSMPGGLRGT